MYQYKSQKNKIIAEYFSIWFFPINNQGQNEKGNKIEICCILWLSKTKTWIDYNLNRWREEKLRSIISIVHTLFIFYQNVIYFVRKCQVTDTWEGRKGQKSRVLRRFFSGNDERCQAAQWQWALHERMLEGTKNKRKHAYNIIVIFRINDLQDIPEVECYSKLSFSSNFWAKMKSDYPQLSNLFKLMLQLEY
jgi:hypothetical protein